MVAVAAEQSMTDSQRVRFRTIKRDALRGEQGSSSVATKGIRLSRGETYLLNGSGEAETDSIPEVVVAVLY